MAETPKFESPDGLFREDLRFSTTLPNRFFTGSIRSDTVDVQVSIRGSGFSSDPDLIIFEGETFTIPNPNTFPDGLDLVAGLNEIQVRAIDSLGDVSPPALAVIRLIQESDFGIIFEAPSGISVERLDNSVNLTVESLDDSRIIGYNFYASTFEGGGLEGYRRINLNTITDYDTKETTTTIGTLTVDSEIVLDNEGNPAADPLYVRVQGTQEDSNGAVLQMDYNERLSVSESVRNLKTTVTVESVREIRLYSFEHNRAGTLTSSPPTIQRGDFTAIPEEDPVYYIIRAVYFDSTTGIEAESPNSPEVLGLPLSITTNIGSFPIVTRNQIVQSTSLAIFRSRPEIDIKPGSVTRDVFINPFADEAQRIRFINDYLHRASSPLALLRIDDPTLSGTSVPVTQSAYKLALKQAFKLTENTDVQEVIDQSFEKYASNFGIIRREGRRARGEVVFFTRRTPDRTLTIPIGTILSGGGVNFRTTSAAQISLENIASFFSGTTGRFSVRVSVQAIDPGSAGNLGPNQIRTIVNGPSGLSVVNELRTFGGTDLESNRDLVLRALNALASVDTGTLQGVRRIATDVPGVQQVSVITPGDPLMQRDYDPITKEHRLGKVDVWVRGSRSGPVTDTFAFRFEISRDALFEIVGNPTDYIFKVVDPLLSTSNPLIEVLDFPALNLGLRNDSTGFDLILTNVQILSYNTIQLDTNQPQPSVSLTDVVRGDIRSRSSERFVFPRQPVSLINSLTGTVTGDVSPLVYELVRADSPLREGRSTKAGDYLLVTDTQQLGITIPSGDPITVTDETHVIVGETLEYLGNLGINPLTVEVYNTDRTIQYMSPFDPSGMPDFTIIDGTETEPLAIKRVTTGNITTGQTLSIDYLHDENFTVSYNTDFLVKAVQDDLDAARHTTADLLAKAAITTPVDFEATIILKENSDPDQVNSDIITNLTNYIGALGLDRPLRQSNVIDVIDSTTNVAFVVTPLTKMVRGEGALIVREGMTTDQLSDTFLVTGWSKPTINVYLILEELSSATTTGGGPTNEFRGVFQDDDEMELQLVNPNILGEGEFRSYIIGNDGLSIPGYSDDTTLLAQGFITDVQKSAERQRISANRILISIENIDNPTNHNYSVTYIVGQDSGVKNIEPGPTEYLTLGQITFTYDEDR